MAGRSGLYSSETGAAFWQALRKTPKPILEKIDILGCPLDESNRTYRAPASDVNNFSDADPVGADPVGAHGDGMGGNVIIKAGSVRECTETDPVWIEAGKKLKN